jgi:diacylglycerol kinase (ATP)
VRTCIILNPEAGSADRLPALRRALARLPDARLVETRAAGHAEELARAAAADGAELVVAAGGDGTLNEVLNGLAGHFGRVRMGVVPVGTGNDFVRSIGIPDDSDEALAILARGHTRRLDVARATVGRRHRSFLNMSAGGFASEVGDALSMEVKSRWGGLAYLRSAAGALPELRAYRTTIRLGDGETLRLAAYLVVVANGRYVASGIPAAPTARLDDGLLDLVVFPAMPLADLVVVIPQTLLGRHVEGGHVIFRRSPRLTIEADPPLTFNADGEPLAAATTRFAVLPQALEVVVGDLEQERDEARGAPAPAAESAAS